MAKRRCGTATGGSRVQSLRFSKSKHARGEPAWTLARARAWVRAHGYRSEKVDEGPGEYRLRQFDPDACLYRSVPFGRGTGIRAVVELPQRAPAHVVRAVEERLAQGG
jgi:hypothetical protein